MARISSLKFGKTMNGNSKYDEFNERGERNNHHKWSGKRHGKKEFERKCFMVFCLWRRNAVMNDLSIDDPTDKLLEKDLKRQWKSLTPDEWKAYAKLTLLIIGHQQQQSIKSSLSSEQSEGQATATSDEDKPASSSPRQHRLGGPLAAEEYTHDGCF